MAYEFKRLADVEALDKVEEGITVLAEVDGVVKRIPGDGIKSSGGALILVATVVNGGGEEMSLGLNMLSQPGLEFDSFVANMTLEDALAAYNAGEIFGATFYMVQDEMTGMMPSFVYNGRSSYGIDCLVICPISIDAPLFWTADGISTEEPAGER